MRAGRGIQAQRGRITSATEPEHMLCTIWILPDRKGTNLLTSSKVFTDSWKRGKHFA